MDRIDITTPEAWYGFFGFRVGRSSYGVACAVSWHAWYVGVQIIGPGKSDIGGIALALGPLWLGIARLLPAQGDGSPKGGNAAGGAVEDDSPVGQQADAPKGAGHDH